MALTLKKAQRKRVKLKIGVSAPSGGGKTASSLILAYGILKGEHPEWKDEEIWSKIAIVDTENGSGELYTNMIIGSTQIGEYNAISLTPPYEPGKFIESIKLCQNSGMEVCIIDSLSHAWSGQGGLLEKQGNVSKRTGNSYTAWREITPLHNALVDTILQSDMHMICSMRAKTEYIQEKDDRGKTTVRKVGLAPIQRDGMEYEFSIFLDIDAEHQAFVSKDRTGTIDGDYFVITPAIGEKLAEWLKQGVDPGETPKVVSESDDSLPDLIKKIKDKIEQLKENGVGRETISGTIKKAGAPVNFNKITDIELAKKVIEELKNLEVK